MDREKHVRRKETDAKCQNQVLDLLNYKYSTSLCTHEHFCLHIQTVWHSRQTLNLSAASLRWGCLITECHSEDIISDPSNMTSDPNPLDSDSPSLFNILSPRGSSVL